MKMLRLVLTAGVLLAACDAPGPSAPPLPSHSGGVPAPNPENAAPCDTTCHRSPFLGGSGG
ncbi:MAG TPA: hypothetical protein VK399_19995 [Longimicrobiaceae bacterium]|jgi:hypothetical protein|nr:hypothetical protein [Longimicrobiaceae bacterium]